MKAGNSCGWMGLALAVLCGLSVWLALYGLAAYCEIGALGLFMASAANTIAESIAENKDRS